MTSGPTVDILIHIGRHDVVSCVCEGLDGGVVSSLQVVMGE